MIRKIVEILEDKCNGCGLCETACHEGAIKIINGKAELISDIYCDGLGDCLPSCPTGAIKIIEREAQDYNQKAVDKLIKEKEIKKAPVPCACPGTMPQKLDKENPLKQEIKKDFENISKRESELTQWPVQLKLVNPQAEFFQDAHLLVAADCTAYAYGDFHKDFIKNRVTVIGCPKLDETEYYKEKIIQILSSNNIKSITVTKMEVPCCNSMANIIKQAMLEVGIIVPYTEVTIGINGSIIE